MKSKFSLFLVLLSCSMAMYSQIQFTANTKAGVYKGDFLYGSNMQYLNNNWSDADVADLVTGNPEKGRVGTGARSLRPALYEYYLEKYGYENRVSTFEHYKKQGVKTNVLFIGDRPTEYSHSGGKKEYREDAYYCKDANGKVMKVDVNGYSLRSKLYKNMYEPIWVDAGNGKKKVNENNYYAFYVYKMVKIYGKYTSFYEIINEPDYTYMGSGDKVSGQDGNWWDKDPIPQSMANLYAPVQSYIRLLRISYEVIKSEQPDALIAVGGIGYESFLDAVLRNTDNPDGGKVTAQYPEKGGAWFDCLSYHLYPMYYLKDWIGYDKPGNINGFRYYRNTDAATDKTLAKKTNLEKVLRQYGYGANYPKKEVIITETNVPNKRVKDFIGGEKEQRNFLIKLAIQGQKEGIKGIYPFNIWDAKEQNQEGGEYEYKGFYHPIPNAPANGQVRMHQSGTAWRIMSNLLDGKNYNENETYRLGLPENIAGGAFGTENALVYSLWAKTTKDLDESASATYTFPGNKVKSIKKIKWDGTEEKINGNKVTLSGEAAFYVLDGKVEGSVVNVESVTITNAPKDIIVENNFKLEVVISPDNAANKNLVWDSSNPLVATVNDGAIKALTVGKVTITATSVDGAKKATCAINIVEKPAFVPVTNIGLTYIMSIGETFELAATLLPTNATDKTVLWKTSNPTVASVSDKGIVTAIRVGESVITARSATQEGVTVSLPVKVQGSTEVGINWMKITPSQVDLEAGKKEAQLTVTIYPEDATHKDVLWSSAKPAVATVDQNGKVTAVGVGNSVITARSIKHTDKFATSSIDVKSLGIDLITLDKSYEVITVGDKVKLTALIQPATAANKTLTWESSNPNVATVDNYGNVTSKTVGKTVITVKSVAQPDKFATCTIDIKVTKEAAALHITSRENKIQITADKPIDQVEIFNLAGNLVYRGTPNTKMMETATIFPVGVAIVRVVIDGKKSAHKVEILP